MQSYNETQKLKLVGLYETGMRVRQICGTFSVPRSTMYSWVNRYSRIKRGNGTVVTANDYYLLEKRFKKIKIENSILKECGCTFRSPQKDRLKAVSRFDGKYTIHALCRVLNVRRSNYYHYKYRRPEERVVNKEDHIYRPVIKRIFEETKGRIGAKKIRVLMANQGYHTSAPRISRLMKEMKLVCRSKRKKFNYNFTGNMKYRKNIVKRKFYQVEPNIVWACDITYIHVNYKPYYMCAIIDLYSRKVIAYKISNNQETSLVVDTFNKAYETRIPKEGLVFHSDQGQQFTAYKFKTLLRSRGIMQSFSNPGCPYDNAVIESFFRNLKSEEVYQIFYKTYEDMKASIDEYIDFFNNKRPHQSLKYLTPAQAEERYYLDKRE